MLLKSDDLNSTLKVVINTLFKKNQFMASGKKGGILFQYIKNKKIE